MKGSGGTPGVCEPNRVPSIAAISSDTAVPLVCFGDRIAYYSCERRYTIRRGAKRDNSIRTGRV